MQKRLSYNRAMYGRTPGWLLPLVFGSIFVMGRLLRRGRRDPLPA